VHWCRISDFAAFIADDLYHPHMHTKRSSTSPAQQGGATLLEVLVSIVILSIGLLGTAGLMINSLRSISEQGNATGASTYARELAERMMANRAIALKATGNAYLFDTVANGWPTSTIDCNTAFCTNSDRATWDVAEWAKRVQNAGTTGTAGLPGAKVKVCYDSLTANGGTANQWACSPGTNPALVVKMAWASKDATGTVQNSSTSTSAPVPRATFIVTAGASL
jgi:type IV pilus assembly protein PilV